MPKTMTTIKLDTTLYARQRDIIELWAHSEYEKATHTDDMIRLTKRLEEAGLGEISDRIVESWLADQDTRHKEHLEEQANNLDRTDIFGRLGNIFKPSK